MLAGGKDGICAVGIKGCETIENSVMLLVPAPGQPSRCVLDGRGRVPMALCPFVMDDNQGCVYV